jgi:hypothetical protein
MSIIFNPSYLPIQEPLRSQPIVNLGLIGIEDILVKLVTKLMEPYLLDTESANLLEDMPMDDVERDQTLIGKVRPSVFAGYIPFTVTGEIIPGVIKIPSITIQALDATYGYEAGSGTVRLLVATYGQTQNRQACRDALNLAERIVQAILLRPVIDETATLAGIDNTPNPINLRVVPSDELNHFYCLITTVWDLAPITQEEHVSTQTPWILKSQPAHPLP